MYVDLAGLARYKQDFGAWARGRLLPKDAAAARVRTAKVGAVSLVPVQETPLDVSVDFMFTETPPASGDKRPSNPSTITGVSSVKTVRCGKNLFAFPKNYSRTLSNGVTVSIDSNGLITLNGTATANGYDVVVLTAPLVVAPGISITISNTLISGTQTLNQDDLSFKTQLQLKTVSVSGSYWVAASKFETSTYTMQIERYVATCQIYIYSGAVFNNLKFKTQAEFGIVSTDFEPYSVDTYILELNGTFYGGTLDVASGVMTVTYRGLVFTGEENWTNFYTPGTGRIQLSVADYPPYGPQSNFGKCTHYPYIASNTDTSPHITIYAGSDNLLCLYDNFSSLQAFKDFLAEQYSNGSPVTVAYLLRTPYTVQLTSQQILSLAQTDKYTPRVNTVYSDASAVQVGYLKHPSAASADLRNALVSLGGGV